MSSASTSIKPHAMQSSSILPSPLTVPASPGEASLSIGAASADSFGDLTEDVAADSSPAPSSPTTELAASSPPAASPADSAADASLNAEAAEAAEAAGDDGDAAESDGDDDAPSSLGGKAKAYQLPSGRFQCTVCPKTYQFFKHLKRHHLQHTGERPFHCDLCSASFTRSDCMQRHRGNCRSREPGAKRVRGRARELGMRRRLGATAAGVRGAYAALKAAGTAGPRPTKNDPTFKCRSGAPAAASRRRLTRPKRITVLQAAALSPADESDDEPVPSPRPRRAANTAPAPPLSPLRDEPSYAEPVYAPQPSYGYGGGPAYAESAERRFDAEPYEVVYSERAYTEHTYPEPYVAEDSYADTRAEPAYPHNGYAGHAAGHAAQAAHATHAPPLPSVHSEYPGYPTDDAPSPLSETLYPHTPTPNAGLHASDASRESLVLEFDTDFTSVSSGSDTNVPGGYVDLVDKEIFDLLSGIETSGPQDVADIESGSALLSPFMPQAKFAANAATPGYEPALVGSPALHAPSPPVAYDGAAKSPATSYEYARHAAPAQPEPAYSMYSPVSPPVHPGGYGDDYGCARAPAEPEALTPVTPERYGGPAGGPTGPTGEPAYPFFRTPHSSVDLGSGPQLVGSGYAKPAAAAYAYSTPPHHAGYGHVGAAAEHYAGHSSAHAAVHGYAPGKARGHPGYPPHSEPANYAQGQAQVRGHRRRWSMQAGYSPQQRTTPPQYYGYEDNYRAHAQAYAAPMRPRQHMRVMSHGATQSPWY